MSLGLLPLIGPHVAEAARRLTAGVAVGIVTNNNDPEGLSRVKVKFPWLSDLDESFWARVAMPMAGNDRGTFFLPEIDDEVLVMFEHGDVRSPYVIGSLWNGKDKPPVDNADGKNNVRAIKSRSGHLIKLDDEGGKESISIVDASGNNSIVIDTAKGSVTITADNDIVLSAPNGTIKLFANNIEIQSRNNTEIAAGGSGKVNAVGALEVKGAIVNIN